MFNGSEARPSFDEPIDLYRSSLWDEHAGVKSFNQLEPERVETRSVFVVDGVTDAPYLEVERANADTALSPSGEPHGIVSQDATGIDGPIVTLNPYDTVHSFTAGRDEIAISESEFESDWISTKHLHADKLK